MSEKDTRKSWTEKACSKCGEVKGLDEFYGDKRCRDGRRRDCKECNRAWHREYNKTERGRQAARSYWNSERGAGVRRRYYRSDKGRARIERRDRGSEEALRKYRARYTLQNAVRDGLVTRPGSCSRCGDDHKPPEAHHPDYGNPLEVVWLCLPCHRREHGL